MNTIENIKKKIDKIPAEYLNELEYFIDQIVKKKSSDKRKMKLNLCGSLKDLSSRYTSVELQHKAAEWMVKDSMKNKKK